MTNAIEYREIEKSHLAPALFEDFDRRQVVTRCLRKVQGQWVVKEAPFLDQWSEKDYEFLVDCLKNTLDQGGVVYGAFMAGKLKGFASVEGKPLGSRGQYRDLTSLHVSREQRGHGIGKQLLALAATWAKAQGADKLYISAHSALETQRFYESQGCVDAAEIQQEHAAREPFDRQMELDLKRQVTRSGACQYLKK